MFQVALDRLMPGARVDTIVLSGQGNEKVNRKLEEELSGRLLEVDSPGFKGVAGLAIWEDGPLSALAASGARHQKARGGYEAGFIIRRDGSIQ
jgi:hypothetical protein